MAFPLSSPTNPKTDIRRVAVLFSGGPAPVANAVIAGAAIAFSRAGIEVIGLKNGYSRLVDFKVGDQLTEGTNYVKLDYKDLEGTRSSAGIMIGTARSNPGKALAGPEDFEDAKSTARLQSVYDALRSLQVDALISIGGDDTLTTAAKFKLFQDRMPRGAKRIRVVHLPKTIDNDYQGIDFTFGYFTAVDLLATQIRNLLADGRASTAWYICQVMGRKAGWLSYGAAIAGEANLVVGLEDIPDQWWGEEVTRIPETGEEDVDPATGSPKMRKIINLEALVDHVAKVMVARIREGKPYGVMVIAEGVGEYLPLQEIKKCISEDEWERLKPDSFGHFPVSQLKFTSRIGRWAADKVAQQLGEQARPKVNGLQFGYEVRCHWPTAFDVILGSQLGVGAFRALAEEGLDGVMVSVSGQLSLVYPRFEDLIDYDILRAHPRPIRSGQKQGEEPEDFHQLARYLETRLD